ncbi:hypothetical protein AB0K71_21125 [Streptomyces syringium]|uniref:hypothetical protein n=1 Tax=Streptomyces syringium TaxID=76729 RepID=UPI00342FDA10
MDKTFGPTDHSDTDKQKAALHRFAKSFVAWDQWKKDASQAFGNVAFNVVTLGAGSFLKLGKAGQAGEVGKLGAGAKAASVMGKAGVILDPMTYVTKAGSVTKLKVGDLMAGLKASQAGVEGLARNVPTGNSPHPTEPNAPSAHPEGQPSPPGSGEKAPTGETPLCQGVPERQGARLPDHAIGATMSFSIQAGCPAVRKCESAADMADAVGEMYSSEAEDAILVWNLVPVRLPYGYDLAALLDDLVPLLEEIQRPEFSNAEVFWGSGTFSAEWKMVREADSLRIQARWHSTLGNYESLLTERGDVVVCTQTFVGEWAKVLKRIVSDIEAEAVELEDDDIFLRAKALLAA